MDDSRAKQIVAAIEHLVIEWSYRIYAVTRAEAELRGVKYPLRGPLISIGTAGTQGDMRMFLHEAKIKPKALDGVNDFFMIPRIAEIKTELAKFNFYRDEILNTNNELPNQQGLELIKEKLVPAAVEILFLFSRSYVFWDSKAGAEPTTVASPALPIKGRLWVNETTPPDFAWNIEQINYLIDKYESDTTQTPKDARSEITERILELERTYAKESSEVDFSGIVPSDRLIRRWEAMGAEIDILKDQLKVLDGTKALTPPAPEAPQSKKRGPKGFEGLGQKVADMSEYTLPAKLTSRQFDCYSLTKEYDLGPVEAGRRLGIKHSTVIEHVQEAEEKIRRYQEKLAGERGRRASIR